MQSFDSYIRDYWRDYASANLRRNTWIEVTQHPRVQTIPFSELVLYVSHSPQDPDLTVRNAKNIEYTIPLLDIINIRKVVYREVPEATPNPQDPATEVSTQDSPEVTT